MPVEIPDKEKKLLLSCNAMLKKKKVSFALGMAGQLAVLLLRPENKDPEAQLVKSAFKKNQQKIKVDGQKVPVKLVTWGIAEQKNGKTRLTGVKAFPAGAKAKIRKFAIDMKLKSFAKCSCVMQGEAEVEETAEEEEADNAALAAISESAALEEWNRLFGEDNPLETMEDEDALDALVDELVERERQESAEQIGNLNNLLRDITPDVVSARGFEAKLKQIYDMGSPEDMLPTTLLVLIDLCGSLLQEMDNNDGEHPAYSGIEALKQEAENLLQEPSNILSEDVNAKLKKVLASVAYISQQIPALIAFLRGADDEILNEIGNSGDVEACLSFLQPFALSLREVSSINAEAAIPNAKASLEAALDGYSQVSGSAKFRILGQASPFAIPLPLDAIGPQMQALINSLS